MVLLDRRAQTQGYSRDQQPLLAHMDLSQFIESLESISDEKCQLGIQLRRGTVGVHPGWLGGWVEKALASSVYDGCALAPLRSGQHGRQLHNCLRTSGHRRKGWQHHQRFLLPALVHLLQSSSPCPTAFLSIGIRHANTHMLLQLVKIIKLLQGVTMSRKRELGRWWLLESPRLISW